MKVILRAGRFSGRRPMVVLSALVGGALLAALPLSCSKQADAPTVDVTAEVTKAAEADKADFQPPTKEDLAKVRWVQKPCVDFVEHLRQAIEKQPSLATEEEALALKNSGPEANQKILSGLGRLPSSDDEVDWEATFNRFIADEPATLNPLFSSSRFEFWCEELLDVGVLQFDWNLEFFGDRNVVESWETSDDGLMDRVVLRKDLTWTDGKPVTAHDVEFTWRLFTDKNVATPARASITEGLWAVKAYDEWTVVYFQKEKLVTNHLHITWPILPRHSFEEALRNDPGLTNTPLNREPVNCGPYRLVKWQPAQELVFERRKEWYEDSGGKRIRSKPFFRRVTLRVLRQNAARFLAFQGGETDDTWLDAVQWTSGAVDDTFYSRSVKVRGEDEWTYAYIGWNARSEPPNPFFGDPRVRLAMTLALDHDFLLKEVFFGIYRPGEGIFHPDSWMAAKELKPFHRDRERSQSLLDAAGWKDTDGDGIRDKTIDGKVVPFRFTASCPNAGSGPKVAQQLKSDLQTIGVACDVQLMEFNAFKAAIAERRLQAFLQQMGTGVDPDTAWNLWHSKAMKKGKGRNDAGYSNPRVDELFELGRREMDRARRAEIYAEIDRLIYQDQPITLLLYSPTLWAFSKSLRGFRPSPKGFYGYAPGFFSIWKKRAMSPEKGVGTAAGTAVEKTETK